MADFPKERPTLHTHTHTDKEHLQVVPSKPSLNVTFGIFLTTLAPLGPFILFEQQEIEYFAVKAAGISPVLTVSFWNLLGGSQLRSVSGLT